MAWQVNKLELTKSALTGCLAENEQSVYWSNSLDGNAGPCTAPSVCGIHGTSGSTGHFRDRVTEGHSLYEPCDSAECHGRRRAKSNQSALTMACTAQTVLVRLKEKVAKLSSSAVTARTRSRELEDAWERINELCKERGAQARAGLHGTVPDWLVAAAREKAGGAPPCFFVATNPASLLRPADVSAGGDDPRPAARTGRHGAHERSAARRACCDYAEVGTCSRPEIPMRQQGRALLRAA